jgi:hypothetical protein
MPKRQSDKETETETESESTSKKPKTSRHTVIKKCLGSSLKLKDDGRKTFLDSLLYMVDHVSRCSHRGSLIFNHYLLDSLNSDMALPFPDFSDQNFMIPFFMLGITNSAAARKFAASSSHILSTFEDHLIKWWNNGKCEFYSLFDSEKVTGHTQPIYMASQQYRTNFFNMCISTFRRRISNYVEFQIKSREWNEKEKPSLIRQCIGGIKEMMEYDRHQFVQSVRDQFGLIKPDDYIGEQWIRDNLITVLRFYRFLLQKAELTSVEDEDNRTRLFTLAPIMSTRRHVVLFDKVGLYAVVKSAGFKIENLNQFKTNAYNIYRQIFHIKESATRKFTGTVATDGKAICFHYEVDCNHTDRTEAGVYEHVVNEDIANDEKLHVIGVDPGRKTIIHGVDGEGREYKLSRREYYHKAHFTKNSDEGKRQDQKIKVILDALATQTAKTASVEEFEDHLRVFARIGRNYETSAPFLHWLWSHYTNNRWAYRRMDNWIHKRQTLDRFFNTFRTHAKGRTVVVAYGAARFNPTGRGEQSVPTTEMSKICKRHYHTDFIDEFRTTKCHVDCGCELHDVLIKHEKRKRKKKRKLEPTATAEDNAEKRVTHRGLKVCNSSQCVGRRWVSRDRNAAIGIRLCWFAQGVNEHRPEQYRRPQASTATTSDSFPQPTASRIA